MKITEKKAQELAPLIIENDSRLFNLMLEEIEEHLICTIDDYAQDFMDSSSIDEVERLVWRSSDSNGRLILRDAIYTSLCDKLSDITKSIANSKRS